MDVKHWPYQWVYLPFHMVWITRREMSEYPRPIQSLPPKRGSWAAYPNVSGSQNWKTERINAGRTFSTCSTNPVKGISLFRFDRIENNFPCAWNRWTAVNVFANVDLILILLVVSVTDAFLTCSFLCFMFFSAFQLALWVQSTTDWLSELVS